jgi:hypothetical protein
MKKLKKINLKIKTKMYDKILIDSTEVTNNFVDIDFLLKKELLIKQFNGNLKVNFVGEVITPNSKIISLPKNFQATESNIQLTVDILKKFRSLAKEGKTLIENRSFFADGETNSDVFYFKTLKKFFTDHITYDFISPKKKINKHTTTPLAANFDVVQTEMNVERFGTGLTYNLKNKSNKGWKSTISLSDIYFSTVKNLFDEFGTEEDKSEFESVKNYYALKGHKFNYIDIDEERVVNEISKNDVSIVHLPIKSHLINYYNSKCVSEKYKIRVFYSKNFEYVWEFFCRKSLKHNDSFKKKINWIESNFKTSNPDVISDNQGKIFIADCKYYNDLNSDYLKELYDYNECQDDKYPVLILVPSTTTEIYGEPRRHKSKELLVVKVSVADIISDVTLDDSKTLSKLYNLISENSERVVY